MRLLDLSLPIRSASYDSQDQRIVYVDHYAFARDFCRKWGVNPGDLPEPGIQSSFEEISLTSHAGTHVDAPSHFGPKVEGKPGRHIDELPLEWFLNDGVVLDFHEKEAGYAITVEDVQAELQRIGHTLKRGEIVLIRTDAWKYWDCIDFAQRHPGMSGEATLWLIDQGIKVMGIDAYGFDIPHSVMVSYLKKGMKEKWFPAHRAGRAKEYCHLEKLANLDQLPPDGFKVSVFPVKIERGSGGWCRAVAILDS